MRILVLGSGGREHALVRALKFSTSVTEVHAVPGSDGISQEAICHALDLNDATALDAFVKRHKFDCVVIGPETLLVDGVADRLRALDVPVVGPSRAAARLEGSKIFAKEFMRAAGVPTANYQVVGSVDEVLGAAVAFRPPYVLKADGLAAGKGVFICDDLEALKAAAVNLFDKQILGESGRRAMIEQFQVGYEISYLVLTNGVKAEALPLAQDHKRLADGDRGPNTGGMGVVAPVKIAEDLVAQIDTQIVRKTLAHLQREGLLYRGVLYIGLMITSDGPMVIEYNVRFGDPEAQVILPLLDGDWGDTLKRLADGELTALRWKNLNTACVVLAAAGYPEQPVKNVLIEGDLGHQEASSYFLHAGTKRATTGEWVTHGGRVLNSIGLGSTLREAVDLAYRQARRVSWPGHQVRMDIGRALTDPLPGDADPSF